MSVSISHMNDVTHDLESVLTIVIIKMCWICSISSYHDNVIKSLFFLLPSVLSASKILLTPEQGASFHQMCLVPLILLWIFFPTDELPIHSLHATEVSMLPQLLFGYVLICMCLDSFLIRSFSMQSLREFLGISYQQQLITSQGYPTL